MMRCAHNLGNRCTWTIQIANSLIAILLGVSLTCVLSNQAAAQYTEWYGDFNGEGYWDGPFNWSDGVPASDTFVGINFGTATIWETDAVASAITMGEYELAGPAGLTIQSFPGGGTSTLTTDHINVGYAIDSFGSLRVYGPQSTLNSGLIVGHSGEGEAFVYDGAHLVTGGVIVGYQGHGEMSLSGAGTRWDASFVVRIGVETTGNLTISSGAVLDVSPGNDFYVGADFSSLGHGDTIVTGTGSQLRVGRQINVGNDGSGVLTITNGAVASTYGPITTAFDGLVFVGTFPGSSGELNVTGAGSQLNAASMIAVGREGEGGMNISAGGVVTSHPNAFSALDPTLSGAIGRDALGVGTVTIGGTGSRWTQDALMAVGYNGRGTLLIENGGTLESQHGQIARNSGSQGTVTVKDSASAWSITDDFSVGGSATAAGGTAALTVSNQGIVTVGDVFKLWPGSTVNVSSNGRINVGSGPAPVGGTVRVGTNGTLTGSGTLTGHLLNDSGTVAPGSSAGILNVNGSYTQTAAGRLEIELGGGALGTQYDQLAVASSIALNGVLSISLINAFTPTAGQSFNILDWVGARFGTFSSLVLPSLIGLSWDTSQLYTSGVLSVIAAELPGDYNDDGNVDAADYVVWRKTDGTQPGYNLWRAHFGQTAGSAAVSGSNGAVPEPGTFVIVLAGAFLNLAVSRRRLRR
jgi:T5SS/PEP-CTERM-associated repeat protein